MSFIKNITESLMTGNIFAAKKAFNNLVMEAVPAVKPNLRDVKELLSNDPKAVVKNFLDSRDGQSLLGYAGDDSNVGIDHFVKYISDVTGVHPNLFKNWNSLKDVVQFYNDNVTGLVELPKIEDPKQYWTHFQMDVIPTDDVSDQDHVMPNTGMGAVTQGQRDDFVGNSEDAIANAERETHVSNRDFGADTDLTKGINHKDARGVKDAQEVGVTNADREEFRNNARVARDAKYGAAGIDSVQGTNVSGAKSFSSRQNSPGGRPKKNNDAAEKDITNKYNAMKLAGKLPAGVKNPTDLKAWLENNS